MTRKMLITAVVVFAITTLLSSLALAGNGVQKGKQTTTATGDRVCPNGNVPQGGQGKGNGYGPADGTGNGGNGPKDGTGYGPGSKSDSTGTGICDGTGPKGKVNKGLSTTPTIKKNGQGKGRRGTVR